MKKYRLCKLYRDVRIEAGLTQVQLAKRLNEPQSYVSKYENGERRLDLIEIEDLCAAVDVSLEDFVRRYLDSK